MKPSDLTDVELIELLDGKTVELEYEDTGHGKFEGNENPGLAARLYHASLDTSWLDEADDSVGDSGLWVARMGRFVLTEDDRGFVGYSEFDSVEEAQKAFDTIAESL